MDYPVMFILVLKPFTKQGGKCPHSDGRACSATVPDPTSKPPVRRFTRTVTRPVGEGDATPEQYRCTENGDRGVVGHRILHFLTLDL
jgi:hypothetical protein